MTSHHVSATCMQYEGQMTYRDLFATVKSLQDSICIITDTLLQVNSITTAQPMTLDRNQEQTSPLGACRKRKFYW